MDCPSCDGGREYPGLQCERCSGTGKVAVPGSRTRVGMILRSRPFVHLWWQRPGDEWPWCRSCGVVKRRGGLITGCRGVVHIGLRSAAVSPP